MSQSFDVRVRKINDDGMWEEWVSSTRAVDGAAALAKVLRRRGYAEYLLEPGRFRFGVEPSPPRPKGGG